MSLLIFIFYRFFLILTLVNNKSYKSFNQEFTFSMMSIPFGVGFFIKFWSLLILFDFNNNFILFLIFLIFLSGLSLSSIIVFFIKMEFFSDFKIKSVSFFVFLLMTFMLII